MSGERGPTLELPWVLTSRICSADVELQFDRNMYAIPPDYRDPIGVEVGIGWPSFSVSQPDYVISENRKAIKFKIRSISLSAWAKKSVHKLSIPFEWRNPGVAPNRIDIQVRVNQGLAGSAVMKLTGFNCNTSIIDFVKQRDDSSFHFPSACSVLALPYWEFSKGAAAYQSAPKTTVRAATWPSELAYWRSRAGTDYLAAQVRKISADASSVPTRIVICPLELGVASDVALALLREMDAHARLGVNVRVVKAKQAFDLLGEEVAIALYGDAIALEYRGATLSQGALSVMLDPQRISDTSLVFEDLLRMSRPWRGYLRELDIDTSREEAGVEIFNRRRHVLWRAAALAA